MPESISSPSSRKSRSSLAVGGSCEVEASKSGTSSSRLMSLPPGAEKVDWEAELGVVIGTPVRRATADLAAAAIAGYTVVNDISVRDFQYHTTQFMPGKAWEGSTPVGPHLVVAEPGDEAHFPIECLVDDRVMQSSNTKELCFGPVALIEYISTFITLVPGDLIITGTPSGVGHARDPAETAAFAVRWGWDDAVTDFADVVDRTYLDEVLGE